eukprot:NODE_2954_length_617_cov_114.255282_g2463_i0.p4 GENE.NODE_2954_length_617_cov_114.255282_g2463_i0~~NODE_2954_length_617_cov_114.255282_g2463_i0.p4  ORF type:complete len:61 (+),score=6.71 NODE_2954_length_617_cov_114.255282_g2463_i0:188-370(+)
MPFHMIGIWNTKIHPYIGSSKKTNQNASSDLEPYSANGIPKGGCDVASNAATNQIVSGKG